MSYPPEDDMTMTVVRDEFFATDELSDDEEHPYLIVLKGQNTGQMVKLDSELTLGRSSKSNVRLLDDGISRIHVRIYKEGGKTIVEDMDSRNGTFINGEKIAKQSLQDGDKIRIGSTTILKFTYQDRLDQSFQEGMLEAALRDPLTKIFNRAHLMDRLKMELHYARRHRTQLAFVLFDLDHFKQINDTFGHLAGDFVLERIANSINSTLRQEDIFARYGGEEFCIVARGLDCDHAEALAERLRTLINDMDLVFDELEIPVSASFGVTSFPEYPVHSPEDMIGAADLALYAAKAAGRNAVRVHRAIETDQETVD